MKKIHLLAVLVSLLAMFQAKRLRRQHSKEYTLNKHSEQNSTKKHKEEHNNIKYRQQHYSSRHREFQKKKQELIKVHEPIKSHELVEIQEVIGNRQSVNNHRSVKSHGNIRDHDIVGKLETSRKNKKMKKWSLEIPSVGDVLNKVQNGVKDSMENAQKKLDEVGGAIGNVVEGAQNLADGALEGAQNLADGAMEGIKDIGEGAQNLAEGAVEGAKNIGENINNGVKDAIGDVKDKIGQGIKDIVDPINEKIKEQKMESNKKGLITTGPFVSDKQSTNFDNDRRFKKYIRGRRVRHQTKY